MKYENKTFRELHWYNQKGKEEILMRFAGFHVNCLSVLGERYELGFYGKTDKVLV